MLTFTGLAALILVFLAGPYCTLQIRWPATWGPRLPVWAHANISLAAAVAVFIHVALRFDKIGPGLLWIGTGLFFVSVFSGLYGMYIATGARNRRRWLKAHRMLIYVLYLSIMPHALGQLLGWTLVITIPAGWALWRRRLPIGEFLGKATWPFPRRKSMAHV